MRQSTMRTLKSVLDENAPEELTDMVRPTCNKRLPVKDKHTSFAGFQIVHDLVLCRDGSYMLEDSYSGMPICSLQETAGMLWGWQAFFEELEEATKPRRERGSVLGPGGVPAASLRPLLGNARLKLHAVRKLLDFPLIARNQRLSGLCSQSEAIQREQGRDLCSTPKIRCASYNLCPSHA